MTSISLPNVEIIKVDILENGDIVGCRDEQVWNLHKLSMKKMMQVYSV